MITKNFIVFFVLLMVLTVSGSTALGYGGPPQQNSSNNYTVDIYTDSESYQSGESVIFSGSVNKYDEDRKLRISVFDGSSLLLTQKILVGTDGAFSHTILLNEKFDDGKYTVKAQYGNSKATIAIISFNVVPGDSAPPLDEQIPDWIKNNARWWADGSIDDSSFVKGMQFLIEKEFMKIPVIEHDSLLSTPPQEQIPDWIKNNARWWADGSIDDSSFIEGIQFLIKERFMTLG